MEHIDKGLIAYDRTSPQRLQLGPLEVEVMEVVWTMGACNVRDVVERLDRKLAYTTVMTTLDRLYKKSLAGPRDGRARVRLFGRDFARGVEPAKGRRGDGRFPYRPGGVAAPAVVVSGGRGRDARRHAAG